MSKSRKSSRTNRGFRVRATSLSVVTIGTFLLEDDPYSELEGIVACGPDGEILNKEVVYRPVNQAEVRRVLERVFRARGLPHSLATSSDTVSASSQALVPALSVTALETWEPSEEVRSAFDAFRMPATDSARAQATPINVCSYAYEIMLAAVRIAALEPWESIFELEPITIQSDTVKLTHDTFIVLSSSSGGVGIAAYESFESWSRFAESVDEEPVAANQLALLYYEPSQVPKAYRVAYRDRGHTGDYYPGVVRVSEENEGGVAITDRDQARTLAVALDALVTFFAKHLDHCDPHAEPATFAIETELGGTLALTYHGYVDDSADDEDSASNDDAASDESSAGAGEVSEG